MLDLNALSPEDTATLAEGRLLAEGGDLSVALAKSTYESLFGAPTTLSDDAIILASMFAPDDYGMGDISERIKALETGNIERARSADDLSGDHGYISSRPPSI